MELPNRRNIEGKVQQSKARSTRDNGIGNFVFASHVSRCAYVLILLTTYVLYLRFRLILALGFDVGMPFALCKKQVVTA